MRCLAVAVADGDHLTVSVLAAIATVQSALLCLAQRNRYGWVCAPHVCHVCHVCHVWLWVAVWLCGCVAVWLWPCACMGACLFERDRPPQSVTTAAPLGFVPRGQFAGSRPG